MSVRAKGQGRGFPRNPEYGFDKSSGDQKRDEMGYASGAQPMLMLRGPVGVPWLTDRDFTISARGLQPTHQRVAFDACYERRKNRHFASYARRLGALMKDTGNWDKSDCRFVEIVKLTKRDFWAGTNLSNAIIMTHIASLQWLGELSRQCMRAVENGVLMRGFCDNVRHACPYELKNQLDEWGIADTGQPNPYDFGLILPEMYGTFISMWRRGDDEQAAEVSQMLNNPEPVGRIY